MANQDWNKNGDNTQRTRKFDAVSPGVLSDSHETDGVYIGERPVYPSADKSSAVPRGSRTAAAPQRQAVGAQNRTRTGATPAGQRADRKTAADRRGAGKTAIKKKPIKRKKGYTQQELAARKKRRSFAFAFFSVVICVSVLLSVFALSCVNDILAMNRSTEKISVSVNQDMTTNQVIDALADKGLIKNAWFCKLMAGFLGFSDTEYLTSVYSLQPSYGLERMLRTMSTSSLGTETVRLIFPEGYTIEQIFAKLEEFEVCSADSLRATAREMDFSEDFPFLASIENPTERYYYLEGYLYPDTYEFYVGENATSVISRFLRNFESHWTDEYAARAAELGMSMDEIINLASIIEKEAYGEDQMYQISSVLHNRLQDTSGAFAYLQCDSTSTYISGIPEDVLSGNDRVNFTKLYDTYQTTGLPAGPICSPGDDAIQAALYPADTDYYYFRHDVNRKIYLARTEQEHNRNGEEVLHVNAEAASAAEE